MDYNGIPKEYTLHLAPNLDDFTCPGWVIIQFSLEEAAAVLTLNSVETDIHAVQLVQDENTEELSFQLQPEAEVLVISLPEPLKGNVQVRIEFTSLINDTLVGFYRSSFVRNGKTEYLAATQFEESEARRAFPCVDHPGYKSIYRIEMKIDKRYSAISKTGILEKRTATEGKELVRFHATPKISSYLLFFGVGEFEYIEEDWKGKKLRVAAVPGRAEFGRFAIESCKKALEYGESYTGIEYPLRKMDLIALTDFAFGAMENFGAITFRENLVLLFPGKSSQGDVEKVARITAHEVSHMWFGDIVSPSSWKYVWLNESYATLFTMLIIDSYFPEWKSADKFVAGTMGGTMERDSLISTMPMELPEEGTVAISPASAPIVYGKGAAVLKMLQSYLGNDRFRTGVQRYLSTYAFQCAGTAECWDVFDQVLREDISGIMNSWIYQPGLPQIAARIEGHTLTLRQSTFSYLPSTEERLWRIPVTLELHLAEGGVERRSLLLDQRELRLDLEGDIDSYKINCRQGGYYRVVYEDNNLTALGALIKKKELHQTDRYGIQADFWAQVKAGRYSIREYIQFIETYYRQEREFLPLTGIIGTLNFIYTHRKDLRGDMQELLSELAHEGLRNIGWEPREGEVSTATSLRESLIEALCRIGDAEALRFCDRFWTQYQGGEAVHPDLLNVILFSAVRENPEAVDTLMEVFLQDETPEPEKIVILQALGEVQDTANLYKVLHFSLESVPPKNRRLAIIAAGSNPDFSEVLWDWFVQHRSELSTLHSFHYGNILNGIIPVAGIGRVQEIEDFCRRELFSGAEGIDETLEMAIERMKILDRLIG